jgi:hypothetical protein
MFDKNLISRGSKNQLFLTNEKVSSGKRLKLLNYCQILYYMAGWNRLGTMYNGRL